MQIREATLKDRQGMIALYHDAGWLNYTKHPDMLTAALDQSLTVLVAAEAEAIIGMVRAVGDGASILYIQDIIVLKAHQRRGIGRRLLEAMDALYPDVYQKILLTEDQPKNHAFYESCGFQSSQACGCIAMMKVKV